MSSEHLGDLDAISEHLGDLDAISALPEDATPSAKPRNRLAGVAHLVRRGVSERRGEKRGSPFSSEWMRRRGSGRRGSERLRSVTAAAPRETRGDVNLSRNEERARTSGLPSPCSEIVSKSVAALVQRATVGSCQRCLLGRGQW